MIDLTNQRFGKLTVINRSTDKYSSSNKKKIMWNCLCDCGNKTIISGADLRHNHTKSCGCYKNEKQYISHKKYNKYDLTGDYGIGFSSNTNQPFYFDLEDYDKIKDYCWAEDRCGYIFNKTKVRIPLHRLIMSGTINDLFDHINQNKKDNRKTNLRLCNKSTNGVNRGPNKNNTTGFKGVMKNRQRYTAYTDKNGQRKYWGTYNTPEEAYNIRLLKEKELFGEFAYEK